MDAIIGSMQRPEMAVIFGVLAVIMVLLILIMMNMKRREHAQNRWFSDVEHALYERMSEDYGRVEGRLRTDDEQFERNGFEHGDVATHTDAARDGAMQVGTAGMDAQLNAALSMLDGLKGEISRLNQRLDGLQSATGELRLLRERLSVTPRGEMASGQLDTLLMQWFAPGRYVRDFEVGTGSGRFADVAILLPDESGKALYLPVDMSFPVEEFADEWNDDVRARLSRALAEHSARLAEQLIKPGLTTDFVIMLLRSELVSARVGELDMALMGAQLGRQVIAVGPAMFWSVARALDGGVSALEMRRSTRQLDQLMQDMRGELSRFTNLLDAGSVQNMEYRPRRRRMAHGAGAEDASGGADEAAPGKSAPDAQSGAVEDRDGASGDVGHADAPEDAVDAAGVAGPAHGADEALPDMEESPGDGAQAPGMRPEPPSAGADEAEQGDAASPDGAQVPPAAANGYGAGVVQARSAQYATLEREVDIWS